MADAYVRRTKIEWPILRDTHRTLYGAYGMAEAGWWALIGPRVLLRYIAMMLRGYMPWKPGQNLRQLGGDILIDPDGIVRLQFVSRNPHDRPSIEAILNVVGGGDN